MVWPERTDLKIAIDTNVARDHLENRAGYAETDYLFPLHRRGQIQLCMSPATLFRDAPRDPLLTRLLNWAARYHIQPLSDWPAYGESVREDVDNGVFVPIPLGSDRITTTTFKLRWNETRHTMRYGQSSEIVKAAGKAIEMQHKDNKDWDLVEAAYVGRCDVLITSDRRMLQETLGKDTLWIVQPKEFVRISKRRTTCYIRICSACNSRMISFKPLPAMHGYCQEISDATASNKSPRRETEVES